jgi:alpha-L-fucosidase
LRRTVKTAQPACLLNSRIGHGQGDYFQTGDNAIPIQVYSKTKWEVPATLNDTWGYKKNDTNWKDPGDLIAKLADITSKGGNYLLNVGPTAEGVIPEASQKILRAIGKWLAVNGESIYGTSPSPFYLPDITWRCTVKPGKVYLHLINWPGRSFRFEGLESEVKRASFQANGQEVKFRRDGNALTFALPQSPVDPYNTVLVLDIADQTPKVAAGYSHETLPARLDLYAWTARLRGEEVRYDRKSASASTFRKAATEKNELWWYPYGSLSGSYDVEITYACDNAVSGSPFQVALHKGNNTPPHAVAQGKIEGTHGRFIAKKLEGGLTIDSGDQHIAFSLPDSDQSAGVRVQKVTLIRR